MNDNEQIYGSDNELLHRLDKKFDGFSIRIQNVEHKVDSIENKIETARTLRFDDVLSFRDMLQKELRNYELKLENTIKEVYTKLETTQKDVSELNNFKANMNGKIYGLIIGVTVVFTIVTFLINKFI